MLGELELGLGLGLGVGMGLGWGWRGLRLGWECCDWNEIALNLAGLGWA